MRFTRRIKADDGEKEVNILLKVNTSSNLTRHESERKFQSILDELIGALMRIYNYEEISVR